MLVPTHQLALVSDRMARSSEQRATVGVRTTWLAGRRFRAIRRL